MANKNRKKEQLFRGRFSFTFLCYLVSYESLKNLNVNIETYSPYKQHGLQTNRKYMAA